MFLEANGDVEVNDVWDPQPPAMNTVPSQIRPGDRDTQRIQPCVFPSAFRAGDCMLQPTSDDEMYSQNSIELIQIISHNLVMTWRVMRRFCLLVNLVTQAHRLIRLDGCGDLSPGTCSFRRGFDR